MNGESGFPVLEVAANAFNLVSILLAGRNSVNTWWTGIAGCALFGLLFVRAKLYADATLQVFYIVTCVLGWLRWNGGGSDGAALPIRRTPFRVVLMAAGAAALVTAGYGALLHVCTDAYAPYVDSLVLAASVVAQVLLMGRRIETWYFWIVVNTVSVPLYLSRGLTLTAVLYVLFWINAIVAHQHWRKRLRAGETAAVSA